MKILTVTLSSQIRDLSYQAINGQKHIKCLSETNIDSLIKSIETYKPNIVLDLNDSGLSLINIKTIISYNIHPIIKISKISSKELNVLTKICKLKKLGAVLSPDFSISNSLVNKFSVYSRRYFDKGVTSNIKSNIHHDIIDKSTLELQYQIENPCAKKKQIKYVRTEKRLLINKTLFNGIGEQLSIKSNLMSRKACIPGIRLACKIVSKLSGLVYGMENLL